MSNQLEGIEQKDVIKRVTGKITKLWESRTFNGKKGEFTIQKGEIEIDGKTYGLMPPQGLGMSPEELAGIMTYVRNNFGNAVGDVVTVEMAKAAIEISESRKNAGKPATGAELTADHMKALPGDPLDPKTMVDPVTLAPVAPLKP